MIQHYPIAISRDVGALQEHSFIADTLSNPAGLIMGLVTIGGGALIGGSKHRLIGALAGLGVLYGIHSAGVTIISKG